MANIERDHEKKYNQLCEAESNAATIKKDVAAATNFQMQLMAAQGTCELLLSKKKIQSTTQALALAVSGLNDAFTEDPGKNHSVILSVVKNRSKQLEEELLASNINEEEELIIQGKATLKEAFLLQSKVMKPEELDSKPIITTDHTTKSAYKIPPLQVPKFDGR